MIYNTAYTQPCPAEFGKLHLLVTQELVQLCKPCKYIVIYGHTKSGKVVIGKKLAALLNRELIISDDYQHLGWVENMYKIREIIKASPHQPFIIEGVQSGRLLRKGVQLKDFYADLVIHLEINKLSLQVAYTRGDEGAKFNRAVNFNKNIIDKIFFDWYELQLKTAPKKMPKIIHMDTSFIF